jgi:thiamine pyrophosphate-dependent acetolactate synthase large subunit-like protein
MLTREQLLEPLARRRRDEVVVTTMGVVRPWARYSDHDLDFASADSAMGHAADLALGIAMAQPRRKVICLNGDGSMLMSLGTLVTIVESGAGNLILFVVVNDVYEITGGQPVPGAGRVDFAALARAAGFARVFHFEEAVAYEAVLDEILAGPGPTFVSVHVAAGSEGVISRSPSEPARYLQTSLADWSTRMRRALLDAETPEDR